MAENEKRLPLIISLAIFSPKWSAVTCFAIIYGYRNTVISNITAPTYDLNIIGKKEMKTAKL